MTQTLIPFFSQRPSWELSFFQIKFNNTHCAPGSSCYDGVVAYFGALFHFPFWLVVLPSAFGLFFSPRPSHKVGGVNLDPLRPAFFSRVSRWTAFILNAPDKRFP